MEEHVYKTIIRPIMLYGVESQAVKKHEEVIVEVAKM